MLNIVRQITYPRSRNGIPFLLRLRKEKLNAFIRMMADDGAYSGFKILNDPILFLSDATAIQSIFQDKNDNFVRSKYIKYLRYLFSGGIFLSDGETWYKQRIEAAPVFANGNFPEMTSQMVDAAEQMFKRWDEKISSNQAIDLNLELTWYALDVAMRALFHQEREDIARDIQTNLGTLLREAETRIWSILSLPQWLSMKLPKYKNALNLLRGVVDDLISERQQKKVYPKDLLSRVIQSYENGDTTYRTLQDKVVAILTSAHETTANALLWSWVEISQRPELVTKLEAQTEHVLGKRPPTYNDIKDLLYARQIFDETLRLYPSVWSMSREAAEEDYLPLDDGTLLKVPKGTTVMLCPYAVHRREKYWQNPLAFDPDRFSAPEISKRPKMSYFPFAGGARLCLGFRFAQIEGIVALSMIAQRYELSLVPGQNIAPDPNITLRPSGKVLFKVRRKSDQDFADYSATNSAKLEQGNSCPFSSDLGHREKQDAQ